jgi:small subunit ribosomal protein S1
MVKGKMGIVKDDVAMSRGPPGLGKPVVETGTVLFSEVLGRTLSGRPLLSTRRLFRRIAWQRVRQVLFSLFSFSLCCFCAELASC